MRREISQISLLNSSPAGKRGEKEACSRLIAPQILKVNDSGIWGGQEPGKTAASALAGVQSSAAFRQFCRSELHSAKTAHKVPSLRGTNK